MSVLIGKAIEKALKNKLIKIEPLDKLQIGPGSIDLTLGNDFRIFKRGSAYYNLQMFMVGSTSRERIGL